MQRYIAADPYRWPYDGNMTPQNTALVVIDMQVDFCGEGGYVDKMGYDISLTRAPIEPLKQLFAAMRGAGYTIIHTREGHKPDLSDLPANKRWRSRQIGTDGIGIGDMGPCGRILTIFDLVLHTRGIRNLILTGITTDVCVHTTMRDANDRGYECLILSDCTAATDLGNHLAALKMVTMQGGVFGAVSDSRSVIEVVG